MDGITLDQFAVFLAITEEGSFAAAGRKLQRAQSAITYAVQKLEEQSGVTLFDRSSYRAVLTQEGHSLLPRIRRIMDDLREFRQQAGSLTKGVEAELVIAHDNFLPLSMFTDALTALRQAFPMVQLWINDVWSQDVGDQLRNGDATLGLTVRSHRLGSDLDQRVVGEFDLVAVASPAHPLAGITGRIKRELLQDHLQIVISNPKWQREGESFGVVAANQWRVSSARLRHNLILAGLGWGSMPYPMVAGELARGDLVALEPDSWDGSDRMPRLTSVVAKHQDAVLGPAAQFLRHALARSLTTA